MKNEFLVDMLQAYFKNETISLPEGITTDEMIHEAELQMLQPYLYTVYKDKRFKAKYIASSLTQERFLELQNAIDKFFNINQIKHIFLKGSILCILFPDVALRTRGDIDVLIEKEDISKVRKLLSENGFKEDGEAAGHHIGFLIEGYEIEVHFYLTSDFSSYDVIDFFKKPFELAECKYEYNYELTHTNHFLFIFLHLVKHLYGGAGLRFIVDFYYMFKSWNDLDMEFIHKKINDFGYDVAYNNVLNSLYSLTGEILDPIMKEVDIKFFNDYLLNCGVHGYAETNSFDNIYNPRKANKKRWFLERVLLVDKAYRVASFPHLGKYIILYPFALMMNGFILFGKAIRKLWKKLFKKKNMNQNKAEEKTELYKKLGIR